MPRGDGTGPIGNGPQDGRGKKLGGRGQTRRGQGKGRKTGGKKGNC